MLVLVCGPASAPLMAPTPIYSPAVRAAAPAPPVRAIDVPTRSPHVRARAPLPSRLRSRSLARAVSPPAGVSPPSLSIAPAPEVVADAAPLPIRLVLPSELPQPWPAPGGIAQADLQTRAPRALVPLYISFGTLQALDYHSTRKALSSGAGIEANPLARGIAKSPPALIAAKAAATTGVIVVGEKMWKKNRVGAVVFVAAMNAAMGVIVAHNYAVAGPPGR